MKKSIKKIESQMKNLQLVKRSQLVQVKGGDEFIVEDIIDGV